MTRLGAAVPFLLVGSLAAAQQQPEASPGSAAVEAADESAIKLDYQQGEITIGQGLAKLNVPPAFRFIGPNDAQKVIVDLWGNPKSDAPLGMLLPADKDPDTAEGWGIIITFEEDGYIKDGDAESINYADLLKDMKEGMEAENAERQKAGFPAIQIVGWATQPRYDKVAKKLYWAKELKFGGATENTLNYNIRILGRRGVLVLNAVAGMPQLAEVEAATPTILGFVDFQSGHRYADYVEGTDKLAAYGIGALIAGKVATKIGFFKGLLALILAGKKFIIIAIVAAGAAIKRLFAGRSEKNQTVAE